MSKWLNMFPPKGGVYETYIPREILIAKPVDYKNIERWDLGVTANQYMNITKKRKKTRKFGVIYLRALYMLQGGFEVMNLWTGNITSPRSYL